MVDFKTVLVNTDGANFPDTLTINSTGAGVGDGTELVKILMDQFVGSHYALMDEAGLTPNSLTEAPGTSQIVESVRRIAGGIGTGGHWWNASDPSVTGDRCLLLNGQVVLIANYPDLVSKTYAGDGNNGTAPAFYKTSDAGGTTRNTAGPYFVLPDMRGYVARGLDVAASVDPDGASRSMGSVQADAFQGHEMQLTDPGGATYGTLVINSGSGFTGTAAGQPLKSRVKNFLTDGINGTPRISSETRMINVATKFYIRY